MGSKSGLCLVASDKYHGFYFTPDHYTQLTLVSCDHPFLWADSLLPATTLKSRSGSRGSFGRWDLYDVQSGSMLKVRGFRGKNPNCTPDSTGIIIWIIVNFPTACALMLGLGMRRCTC